MNIREKFDWGSHIPLNKSLLEIFDVSGVVELGIGHYSTGTFIDSGVKKLLSIETDKSWIANIIKKYPEDDNHKYFYHETFDVLRGTPRWKVPKQTHEKNISLYKSLNTSEYNFLFVDNIASLRRDALEILHNKFDIVVFHDTQDHYPNRPKVRQGSVNHSYANDPDLGTFKPGSDYAYIQDKSIPTNTSCLIRKNLMNKFYDLVEIHIRNMNAFISECLENNPGFSPKLEILI